MPIDMAAAIGQNASSVPSYLGGTDLATLSQSVADASQSGDTVFLATSTDNLAVAQAAANASEQMTAAIAAAASTTDVLAQIAARNPAPTKVSLVGSPDDFPTELRTALSTRYSVDSTLVSADPVQWSLAAHDSAYRKRIVIGDGAVPNSQAYAAALAASTRESLVLVDATHDTGVAALVDDPNNISATVIGDYSSLTELQSLSEASSERLTNIPVDDLARASLQLEKSAISAGGSAKRLVAANADDPATMALAGRYASAVHAIVTDRSAATAYLAILRSAPASTTLVGTGASASSASVLAAERPAPAPSPGYRILDTSVTSTDFTVRYTTIAGAATYTARDADGTQVGASSTNSISVAGSPYNLAITATDSTGSVLGVLQYRINDYEIGMDRARVLIASNSGDGTYIRPLSAATVPRLITRTTIPATGGVPQPTDTVNVAVTCEPDYTDPQLAQDQQYNYNVYVLSNDPATCEAAGSPGDPSVLDTLGVTLPATAAPAVAATSTLATPTVARTSTPYPKGLAATRSAIQAKIHAAQASATARTPGQMTTQAVGDDWPPIMFRYQTFIPPALIPVPGFSGDITHPFVLFNGNNRTYDPFGDSKTRQDVTVTFGSTHSITAAAPVVGQTIRYKCNRPWGGSCTEVARKTASSSSLAINDIASNPTGGFFTFHVDAANPLYSIAPPISSDLHVSMGYRNTWIYGRHDNMPIHEIYFDVVGWDEWQYAYASWWYNPVCLAGELPGCSTFVVVPL